MNALQAAIDRWPGLELTPRQVRDYVDDLGEGAAAIADEAWPEVVLACACRLGDTKALALFDRHYLEAVVPAVAHMNLGRARIDDVKQEVANKLLVAREGARPKIDDYVGKGRLEGLVRVMAVRTAISMLRKDKRIGDDEPLARLADDGGDLELQFMKETYRAAFRTAFEGAVRSLTSRQRNILRLQLDGGLTVDQIAEIYGVHRATLTRWLTKTRRELMEQTRRGLQRDIGMAPGELDSLMGLIQSRLDVSVRRLLQTITPEATPSSTDPPV